MAIHTIHFGRLPHDAYLGDDAAWREAERILRRELPNGRVLSIDSPVPGIATVHVELVMSAELMNEIHLAMSKAASKAIAKHRRELVHKAVAPRMRPSGRSRKET